MSAAPSGGVNGFAFHPASESLTLSGAEYGTTFVTPDAVARLAREAGFLDVRWREHELWCLQDVFVLSSSRQSAAADGWTPAPVLDGAIDGLHAGAQGAGPRELWLHGWVECRDPDEPVERAMLHLGERAVVPVVLHASKREQRSPESPAWRAVSEWHHHAVLPPGMGGRTLLSLVAETRTQRRCVDVRAIDFDRPGFLDGPSDRDPPAGFATSGGARADNP